jgi:hypothetical protein
MKNIKEHIMQRTLVAFLSGHAIAFRNIESAFKSLKGDVPKMLSGRSEKTKSLQLLSCLALSQMNILRVSGFSQTGIQDNTCR